MKIAELKETLNLQYFHILNYVFKTDRKRVWCHFMTVEVFKDILHALILMWPQLYTGGKQCFEKKKQNIVVVMPLLETIFIGRAETVNGNTVSKM